MSTKPVSVIGCGRLGLCFSLILEKAGYDVLGCDVNTRLIEQVNNRTFVSDEPQVNQYLSETKNLKLTSSLSECLEHSDLIWILVDTPTGANGTYDHSKLGSVLNALNTLKITGKTVVIGCTVMPSYFTSIVPELTRDCIDCTFNYNPEFIAQGNIINGLLQPDMVLIGADTIDAFTSIKNVYEAISEILVPHKLPEIKLMSPQSAELCKLALNCFITMKIAFANYISDVSDLTRGANAQEILSAIGCDSRIGSKCLVPGYGFGGMCFPRDNRAFGTYVESLTNLITPVLNKATETANKEHAEYMARDLAFKTGFCDSEVVFRDVCFKPDCKIVMIEESQKLRVACLLKQDNPELTVIIQDRKEVIDAVRIQYGNKFVYEIV